MQLLLIRHAIAQDRDEFARGGRPDAERPLTDLGRRRMRAGTKGLRQLVSTIDLLATSPLVRTTETANIVAEAYALPDPTPVVALTPDATAAAFLSWLRAQDADKTIAVVGHDPGLPHIVGLLLTGKAAPIIAMKKGAVCLLSVDGLPRTVTAVLRWSLAPAHLRDLGRL
ncbi:MAG: histidine phosphatase family protein [Gemmatimonadaceae bacterium]|nr:histidine phosphatase family protein [Gemmatimonadaceae bacterium]